MKKHQKGFTLVELMATLGILALIVLIAIPAIGGIMNKAETQADYTNIKMAEKSATIAHAAGLPFDIYIRNNGRASLDTLMDYATTFVFGATVSADGGANTDVDDDGIYYIKTLVSEGFLAVNDSRSFKESDFVGITHEGDFAFNEKRDKVCVGFREHMATDDDFSGSVNGYFKYTGTSKTVCIPHVIKGVNVTDYNKMFNDTTVEKVISDNPNVSSMRRMFENSRATRLDVSNLNTSKVSNMSEMFLNSRATSLDVSRFDTSKVSDTQAMFRGSSATRLNLSNFNTENVRTMNNMFRGSNATHLDLSSFNTEKVTSMYFMFEGSKATSLDISSFETSNVKNMYNMFQGARITSLDLSNFDFSSIVNFNDMFQNSHIITGYAKNQTDVDKLNGTSNKPNGLIFIVK